jgi:hypothetical protein
MRIGLAAVLAAVTLPAAAAAQIRPLALEVRGGLNWAVVDLESGLGMTTFPNGEPVAAAEQHGWTGSADLYWTLAPRSAVYIGWNHAGFKCKEEFCGTDGKIWSAGPEFGFKFSVLNSDSFNPWFRLGLLAHKAKYKEGPAPEENSVRAPGIEMGVGTDLTFANRFALVPAVRFYRYNAGWDLGTPEAKRVKKNIGWFQTDLGLQLKLGNR